MLLRDQKEKGFSLVELVTVIVLLSILSVAALSRFDGLDVYEEKAFFDEVTNALRYAHKLAQSTGCNVRVSIQNQNSYRLQQGDSCTSTTSFLGVMNPANRPFPYQNTSPAGSGIAITPNATFSFTAESTVTGLAVDTVFNVGSFSLTVHRNTGLVSVN